MTSGIWAMAKNNPAWPESTKGGCYPKKKITKTYREGLVVREVCRHMQPVSGLWGTGILWTLQFLTCHCTKLHVSLNGFVVSRTNKRIWLVIVPLATCNSSANIRTIIRKFYCVVAVNIRWPATALGVFKDFITTAKFREPPLCCAFVSSFWVEHIVDVTNCFSSTLNSN